MTPREAILMFYDQAESKLKEKVDYCQSTAERYALEFILKGDEDSKATAIQHHQQSVTYRDALAVLLNERGIALRACNGQS